MGMFLNSKISYETYKSVASGQYFVDKTTLLGELFPVIETENRFLCLTRPRRFGKSIMAHMIHAFFGKTADARHIFDSLIIAQNKHYAIHLNQYSVIYIDFSRPDFCDSYQAYIERIINGLKQDLTEYYPSLLLDRNKPLWDSLQTIFDHTGEKFMFIMDEWDAVFHKAFIREKDKKAYLEFLRDLLKGQIYVSLAYMTGVLPITKYSSGSDLNMFLEYDMTTKKKYSEYFGFSDAEVDRLFFLYLRETEAPEIHREDLRIWYDGYYIAKGKRIYNPRSVVCALSENELSNYWTSSGPYDEIFYYVRHNIEAVREDLALMVAGEAIPIVLDGYAVTEDELKTKNQIYSAMVVYGLLTYDGHAVSIPNKELMDQFHTLLRNNDSLGYVHHLAMKSEQMLAATLAGDTKTMTNILQFAHNTESPILSYNSEIELSALVNLVYLAARDRYQVEREDKAGKGYVDFIFYPELRYEDAIILELKIDSSPKEAIDQIKEKDYALRFQGKLGEDKKYTGRVLAVGISYDRNTKEHECLVEVL